MRSKTFGNN
jgi:hypothetical protein